MTSDKTQRPHGHSGLRIWLFILPLSLLLSLAMPTFAAALIVVEPPGGNLSGAQTISNSPATGDLLQLLDGSSLHGHLQSADGARGIRWLHPDAVKALELKPTGLDRIQFENAHPIAGGFKPSCRFRFRNGDEIPGNLLALDDDRLMLESWFGSDLKVPSAAVESITFQKAATLYEGPTGLEGWTAGQGFQPWRYGDGAFDAIGEGTCMMGRDFKLSGSIGLEFDLAWTGSFVFKVPFCTEGFDRMDYKSSSYTLQITPGAVSLLRVEAGNGVTITSRNEPAPQMAGKTKMHVELRASKADATIQVFLDGQQAARWKEDKSFLAQGPGIAFYAQLAGHSLRLSNIRLSEWEGSFPTEKQPEQPVKADTLDLINRDQAVGALRRIRDGMATLSTGQADLTIPLTRVTQIFFATTDTNKLSSNPREARVQFAGGGTISLELDKWEAARVTGRSGVFGSLSFDPQAVRWLEFNPGADRRSSLDVADGGWRSDVKPDVSKPAASRLLFRNGDVLLGNLLSITSAQTVRWERPDALQAIELKPDGVSEIQFAPRQTASGVVSNACHVRMLNGDELEGGFTAMDAEKLVLETEFAGRLNIPRVFIDMVRPLPLNRAVVFSGPTGMEGWTIGKIVTVPEPGEWSYKDGAFYATRAASIARDVKLPEVASIQFDLTWQNALQEAIALYTGYMQPVNLMNKDKEPDFGGFYTLQFSSVSRIISVRKSAPLKYFADAPTPWLNQKNSTHVEIRVNKPKFLVALLVDGALVKEWTDTEFAGTGTGMRFVHQGLGAVKLSNLRITEWDGQFEEAPDAIAERKQDVVKLRNGDKAAGSFEKMRDGKITIAGADSKLDIPVERVKQIEFASQKTERPLGDSADVRAFLEGGNITFHLERWDAGGVTGSNSILGKLKIKPGAFERIQFLEKSAVPPGK